MHRTLVIAGIALLLSGCPAISEGRNISSMHEQQLEIAGRCNAYAQHVGEATLEYDGIRHRLRTYYTDTFTVAPRTVNKLYRAGEKHAVDMIVENGTTFAINEYRELCPALLKQIQ